MRGTQYNGFHFSYFDRLRGPNGEKVDVKRLGSCCAFENDSLPFGGELLDRYQLHYEGLDSPTVIYVNLYEFDEPKAPVGFILL